MEGCRYVNMYFCHSPQCLKYHSDSAEAHSLELPATDVFLQLEAYKHIYRSSDCFSCGFYLQAVLIQWQTQMCLAGFNKDGIGRPMIAEGRHWYRFFCPWFMPVGLIYGQLWQRWDFSITSPISRRDILTAPPPRLDPRGAPSRSICWAQPDRWAETP